MNLVVLAADPQSAEAAEEIVDSLRDHHPSRVVILIPSDGGDGVDARIEILSRADRPGGRTLQMEQIVLRMHGGVAAHAASAVDPLLRHDLPTFLWWPAAPDPAGRVFGDLRRLGDRAIVESGRSLPGPAALRALAAVLGEGHTPLTDLAWAAVTPWRQAVATTLRGAALDRVRATRPAVTIVHGGPEAPLGALLLGGWLAAALGGDPALAFRGEGGGEDILGVRVAGAGSTALEIVRDRGRSTVTVASAAGGPRCMPVVIPSRVALLAGELEYRGRDRTLERAVAHALRAIALSA
jgi:glucose-6-phosphate dehydrogenase assembly protein OpcA